MRALSDTKEEMRMSRNALGGLWRRQWAVLALLCLVLYWQALRVIV